MVYTVVFKTVVDAQSPFHAAQVAVHDIMFGKSSNFSVSDHNKNYEVDLDKHQCNEVVEPVKDGELEQKSRDYWI